LAERWEKGMAEAEKGLVKIALNAFQHWTTTSSETNKTHKAAGVSEATIQEPHTNGCLSSPSQISCSLFGQEPSNQFDCVTDA
jgi:hypothetical protein